MAKTPIAKFNVRMIGVPKLQARFRKAGRHVKDAIKQTLFQGGETMMTNSKRQVPVDTGNLRSSGHVTLPFEQAGGIFIELGYGGPAGAGNHGGVSNTEPIGYALKVHENLQAAHTPGQKAKYLEDPIKEYIPKLTRSLDVNVTRAAKRK